MNETNLTELLKNDTPGLKLSFYQPTHPASSEQTIREDSIRFKNALQTMRLDEAYDVALDGTMDTLRTLVDDIEFWKYQARGLAVFADEKGYHTVQLHYDVTEAYYMQEQFQLSPLVLADSLSSNYYLLDINHTRPRLLYCSPSSCSELVIDGMPGSLESETKDVEYTSQLQHQSGGVGGFHGHDDSSALQDDVHKYYRAIVTAVELRLAGQSDSLVLVGVENRVGQIRKMLSYAHTLDDYVEGSGEAMNEQMLHNKSIKIIEQSNSEKRRNTIHAFQETNPALTAVGDDKINEALLTGRVATLLIPAFILTTDTVREGYDAEIVLQLGGQSDLSTELLIRSTLRQGGAVIAVAEDSFEDDRLRAVCRF
jgi:hypothetical protein